VAVEESIITDGGKPRRVEVPVEMPEGVSYQGVFGGEADAIQGVGMASARQMRMPAGVIGGIISNRAAAPPPPPAQAPKVKAKGEALYEARDQVNKIDPSLLKRTGKVTIRVFLVDAGEMTLAELKKLGFEIVARPGAMKMVIGRIEASKLKQLSELPGVKYVAPEK
jgi:Ca-activated chloride channel homolog